jgi:RND superfamily putative drug exporter
VILLFVFGTLPAVLTPLVIATAAILNTFTLVWALTYVTDVSIIVSFLIGLIGLGLAIDYALVMLFRLRDELREGATSRPHGRDTDPRRQVRRRLRIDRRDRSAVTGPAPRPLLRSVGIGGMLIPAVSRSRPSPSCRRCSPCSVSASTRSASCRADCSTAGTAKDGPWGRWARFVLRRPVAVAAVGHRRNGGPGRLGTQLRPTETELSRFPASRPRPRSPAGRPWPTPASAQG